MKLRLILLIVSTISFYSSTNAQDSTKILFIGNSFTSANNLQDIVKQFFLFDKTPVYTYAYAPGGITVGDVAMGTAAHMNNPLVFQLIRETDWDFLVLQDNQGRFALDSAVFPPTSGSKVIEGHLKIRDSLHYYHSCAKMIWFSGWGFKDEDTSMINQITTNYRVLNSIAKDVIAPIGSAWKSSIIKRPSLDLWSGDAVHPDITGSFLTASVIYGVITQKDVTANAFNHTLLPIDASYLKSIAQMTLSDVTIRQKSNLKGVESVNISWDKSKSIIQGSSGRVSYQWYFNNSFLSSSKDSILKPAKSGIYRLWTQDSLGYWQKSCNLQVSATSVIDQNVGQSVSLSIFPNPASNALHIKNIRKDIHFFRIYSLIGDQELLVEKSANEMSIDISQLSTGIHLIACFDKDKHKIGDVQKFFKQ